LVALWAIIPRADRLNAQVKMDKISFFILFILLVVPNFLVLFPEICIEYFELTKKDYWWKKFLRGSYLSYFSILIIGVSLILKLMFSKISDDKLPKLNKVSLELYRAGRVYDLADLLKKNNSRIKKFINNDFLSTKIRKKINKVYNFEDDSLFYILENRSKDVNKFLEVLLRYTRIPVRIFYTLVPDHKDTSLEINNYLNHLLSYEKLVSELVEVDPEFATDLLGLSFTNRRQYLYLYFKCLLNDKNSRLYFEIFNNQNIICIHRYSLDESNYIINSLFGDAYFSKELGLWEPLGELIIEDLDSRFFDFKDDDLNLPFDKYFDDKGRWVNPVFCGFRLFDIMVSEALYQGVGWHMWLYYSKYIVENIGRNYSNEFSDENSEFPNRYCYILYCIFSAHRDWVLAFQDQCADRDDISIESESSAHENNNIPKSSIISMGECYWRIFVQREIPLGFKQYMLSIILNLYFELKKLNADRLANVLLESIKYAGGGLRREEDLIVFVQEYFQESFDKVPHRRYLNEFTQNFG
jgi:hypothetical protein